jgi:WD40 repeat protein
MWDLATQQSQQIAQHDAAIQSVAWVPDHKMVVTGSWDKTVRDAHLVL